MSGNPLVLKVPDIAAFTLYAVNMFISILSCHSEYWVIYLGLQDGCTSL